jgi:transposase
MFIRQKKNKSGTVSIQIIDKSRGSYKVFKTIGSSSDPIELDRINSLAKTELLHLIPQLDINFNIDKENELIDLFYNSIDKIRLVGPELVLGKLFDEIGFNLIKDELFRHLVITRLCYPVSKLKTTDYLFKYKGISIEVDRIYRYLDKLHDTQKESIQEISYSHTLKILEGAISVVFYDVTTLYFEIEDPDDLRIPGFSKDGKNQNPQILLGLLVSNEGYPLAYEIFEGNKFEGHTMLPVIEAFKTKYRLKDLVVVADAGLLSDANILALKEKNYQYILGARPKNEKRSLQSQILALKLENGQSVELEIDPETRLIISYSQARAKKDISNRRRGLEKLERAIRTGRLSKKNINNRGYNKYLKLEGEISISIDYEKFNSDSKWDGLKGYQTNTKLNKDTVIEQYGNLWKIERAFRISKSDLRIRPIFHRLRNRIEAHICIAFCAYKIYKELERNLKLANAKWSPEKAIDIAKTIFEVTIIRPYSKTIESRLHLPNDEQVELLELFRG